MAVKVPLPTFADTYGGVAVVSCLWVILSYAVMPLGPLAGLKKCSAGQQKWCAVFNLFLSLIIHATATPSAADA